MTGYILSAGYSCDFRKEETAEELVKVAREICGDPEAMRRVALSAGGCVLAEGEEKVELIELIGACVGYYSADLDSINCRVDEDGDGLPYVFQGASGGGPARTAKELVRQAFCREVIRRMHGRGMNVNLHVT